MPSTHEVTNQPPPLVDYNLYLVDPVLQHATERAGASWIGEAATEFGAILGTEEVQRWGVEANETVPVLQTHDRFGRRRDEVEFHPSWHMIMGMSVGRRLHSLPWHDPQHGAHAARASLLYLAAQAEAGHLCPLSMTYASVPVIRQHPRLLQDWEPRIHSNWYDPGFAPIAKKNSVLVGMAMTEKQGGSDVRANSTTAMKLGGDQYLLTGHKWFCSAPMCDAFLVLAQAPGGLTCFFLPRWTFDGDPNHMYFQRLKRKLGNRSNASSEVEFEAAWALRIGEEGRGVATIIDMVNHTRLDCVVTSAALMRQSLVQAMHHCRHRSAFGKLLGDQPLMKNVLADLAIECEAATLLGMRLAQSFDDQPAFARLATAVAKYWVTKRSVLVAAEAMECLGGNGYVEESMMPRIYREAPLNSIWEGSGNVNCLDVLRAVRKDPASLEAVLAEIARSNHPLLDNMDFTPPQDEALARRFTERLALGLQASLIAQHSSPAVIDAFLASRLGSSVTHSIGTLPEGTNFDAILKSAWAA